MIFTGLDASWDTSRDGQVVSSWSSSVRPIFAAGPLPTLAPLSLESRAGVALVDGYFRDVYAGG